MTLALDGVAKSFGTTPAVSGIDLALAPGEFFTLLGPSGCGKTTILRVIAGIYAADAGRIRLGERDITGVPMHRRHISLMFQNYALFPHLTAFGNVAFGLRMRRVPRAELRTRVAEALALVHLEGFEDRLPSQLSGGQQQRVALARALVVRPELLLLDEPLSNLDARLRDEMRTEIRDLQRRLGIATLLVTHDIAEAFAMSDRIAVLRAGRIEQVGVAAEIYRHPATRFVARFVGATNELPIESGTLAGRPIRLPPGPAAATLVLRPEHLRLGAAPDATDNWFEAEIEDVTYLGSQTQCRLRLGPHRLIAEAPSAAIAGLVPGTRIGVGWQAADGVMLGG